MLFMIIKFSQNFSNLKFFRALPLSMNDWYFGIVCAYHVEHGTGIKIGVHIQK